MATLVTTIPTFGGDRLRALWSGARSWAGKGSFALLDQGLQASANFLVTMLLARLLTPAAYGAYAIAFEAFLLLTVLYASLVLEPMSVFGPSVYRDNMREYLGVLVRLHPEVSFTIILVVGAWAYVAHLLAKSGELSRALWGMGIAAPVMLLLWVARRAFYVRLEPKVAAAGGAVYSGVLLIGLSVVYLQGWLSPFVAFLLMALGAAVAGSYLWSRLKPSVKLRPTEPSISEVVERHFKYGRWAVLSAIASWASGAVYYLALSSSHGLADAGALKALLNLSSPAGQVFAAFSLLTLPFASRTFRRDGAAGIRRVTGQLFLLYVGGNICYWSALILFRGPVIHLLYGDRYSMLLPLVPWIGLASILRIATTAQAIPLRAVKAPLLVFYAYGASATVDCLVGVPVTWRFGLRGAVLTDVFSNAAALVVVYFLLRRKLRQEESAVIDDAVSLGQSSLRSAS